jgi:hypothetical protein
MSSQPDVFTAESFRNPDRAFRPLQIIHGFDRSLADPQGLTGEEGIDRLLDTLCRLGIGGIVCNVGGGFGDYLQSERQWEIWLEGLHRATTRGMTLWWYDEKGYPSGSAGGIVTRADPSLAALGLACYTLNATGPSRYRFHLPASCLRFQAAFACRYFPHAAPDAVLTLNDCVDDQGYLDWTVPPGEWTILYLAQRYMYEGTHAAANVCEFKYYPNLLEPRATQRFLQVTHEQYARRTPPELWRQIRAVFTDEPSLMVTYAGELPERFRGKIPIIDAPLFRDRPPAVPWSSNLHQAFIDRKGYDLDSLLWCLFCGEHEAARMVRQDFYEVVTEVYTDAYYRQTRRWCDAHDIAFSGHLMAEEWLPAHVAYHGSLFAPIRQMNLPGIDMLDSDPVSMLNGLGFLTAKQVASIAHLTGAEEVHSECSDWVQRNSGQSASLAQRCGQGNLLYVLGVNQVTAYWNWQDIGEDAYRQYNDYMARLASLLRGGIHRCDVAILYPIRSAWLDYLPQTPPGHPAPPCDEASRRRLQTLGRSYTQIVRDLLRNQIDLDIIDEQALCEGAIAGNALRVAGEAYRIIVLPGCEAISSAAAAALGAFAKAGGMVVSVGSPPRLGESIAATPQVQAETTRLFAPGGGGIVIGEDKTVETLQQAGAAVLKLAEANPLILCTQRELYGRGLCFIVNAGAEPQNIRPSVRLKPPLDLYRPLDGSITAWEPSSSLTLGSYEGVFLVERTGA